MRGVGLLGFVWVVFGGVFLGLDLVLLGRVREGNEGALYI